MPTQLLLHIADCPELLKSRNLILGRFWNVVATDSKSAWQIFRDNDFDMAVVCHSVPAENYEWLKRHIQLLSPSTPVLRVTRVNGFLQAADERVVDDPQALLAKIRQFFGHKIGLKAMEKGA